MPLSRSSTMLMLDQLDTPPPLHRSAAIHSEFKISDSVYLDVRVSPLSPRDFSLVLSLYQDDEKVDKYNMHVESKADDFSVFTMPNLFLEWMKTSDNHKLNRLAKLLELHQAKEITSLKGYYEPASEQDIETFYRILTLVGDTPNEQSSIKLLRMDYLLYLRDALKTSPFADIKWTKNNNLKLLSRIKAARQQGLLSSLDKTLLTRIINDIHYPLLRLKLDEDDKSYFLESIEIIENESIRDLNEAFKNMIYNQNQGVCSKDFLKPLKK